MTIIGTTMKTKIIILLTLIIYSCAYIQEDYNYWYCLPDDSKVPENIKMFKQISDYVYGDKGIKYKANYGKVASPQVTLDMGYGSCFERSLLILALIKKRNNYKGALAIGDFNNSNTCNHAEAYCHKKIINYGNNSFKIWQVIEWQNIASFIKDYNNVY